jgi:transcriptional regulator with XRE-family HTH domain
MFHMRNITGRRIQAARQAKNLTQNELAIKLQMLGFTHTRNTIAKIENGFRQVTDIELRAIATALEVSVAWLFEEED